MQAGQGGQGEIDAGRECGKRGQEDEERCRQAQEMQREGGRGARRESTQGEGIEDEER
jgi:hypothetical protein